eukprot:4833971-Pyramimonas_sp.AAC.1
MVAGFVSACCSGAPGHRAYRCPQWCPRALLSQQSAPRGQANDRRKTRSMVMWLERRGWPVQDDLENSAAFYTTSIAQCTEMLSCSQ